jgi:hypothetical protein
MLIHAQPPHASSSGIPRSIIRWTCIALIQADKHNSHGNFMRINCPQPIGQCLFGRHLCKDYVEPGDLIDSRRVTTTPAITSDEERYTYGFIPGSAKWNPASLHIAHAQTGITIVHASANSTTSSSSVHAWLRVRLHMQMQRSAGLRRCRLISISLYASALMARLESSASGSMDNLLDLELHSALGGSADAIFQHNCWVSSVPGLMVGP